VIKEGVYAIHECYYNEKGAPHSISTDEMAADSVSSSAWAARTCSCCA